MPRRPAPLPESLGRAFTFADATAQGLTPGRLRHRSLITPTPGIRLTEQALELRVRAAAYAKLLPPGAAFSHQTGAALLRLPAPEDDKLHVTVPDGVRFRRQGVVEHRGMQRRELGHFEGLPTTAPEQTWLDLAPISTVEQLVILGDAILQNFPERESRLRRISDDNAGARGIRRAREAIGLVRRGVRSPQETSWRLRFRAAGLPEPKLNEDVSDELGRWLGMVDFVWRDQRVIAEYDGDYHFTVEQRRLDQARRRAMRAAGWAVIEINGADNRDPGPALTEIGAALGRRNGAERSPDVVERGYDDIG